MFQTKKNQGKGTLLHPNLFFNAMIWNIKIKNITQIVKVSNFIQLLNVFSQII